MEENNINLSVEEILRKQVNAENIPITKYLSEDGYVWKMVIKAMEEYKNSNDCEWVNVKDRLPDNKKDNNGMIKYIVIFNEAITTAKYVMDDWFLSMPDRDELLDEKKGEIITHWQPLPKPPKELKQ